MHDFAVAGDRFQAGATMATGLADGIAAPRMRAVFECRGPDGELKWREEVANVVTTVGKTFAIDTLLKGSAYTAAWYLGLKGSGTPNAADTLASHAGWTEVTPYSGNRKSITWGTSSGGGNTGSAVAFAITGPATIAGGFICDAASGTSGTLYNAANFSNPRTVDNGDTLNVTPELSFT